MKHSKKPMATPIRVSFLGYISDMNEIAPGSLYLMINDRWFRVWNEDGEPQCHEFEGRAYLRQDMSTRVRSVVGMCAAHQLHHSPFNRETLQEIAVRLVQKGKIVLDQKVARHA